MEIGFSQRIQLEWLQLTAGLLLAEGTRSQIQVALQEFLQEQLSVGGTAVRGNREKAITILLKIWVSVPKHVEALRDDGLGHLKRLPSGDHLPVHWGMCMAVYPFFAIVAETVGRLLRLQGSVSAAHVQRRLREQLGERETVARAARRVLRCFVDWGVLEETGEKGVYQASPVRLVQDTRLSPWLIEATLVARNTSSGALKAIVDGPALFPFSFASFSVLELQGNNRLEWSRQGLDEDTVTLRYA